MHKPERKVPIKRKKHRDLTFWLILKFLHNYPAKSEIKGLIERKKPIIWIFSAQVAMPCILKKYIALENVQFLKFRPFFEKIFFSKN